MELWVVDLFFTGTSTRPFSHLLTPSGRIRLLQTYDCAERKDEITETGRKVSGFNTVNTTNVSPGHRKNPYRFSLVSALRANLHVLPLILLFQVKFCLKLSER